MSNIQISEELFIKLIKYHLLEINDDIEDIKKELDNKLNKIVNRQLYSQYLKCSENEKKEILKKYIENKTKNKTVT